MIYFGTYAVAALLAFSLRHSAKTGRALYPFLLAFFFLVSAFRFEVGCDWSGYLNQFKFPNSFTSGTGFSAFEDPLWWFLVRHIHDVGLAYPWLNVASAIIFFAGVHVLARKQPDPFAFLVLLWPILIINITMSGIRQAAAVGLLCAAFVAFTNRKVVLFAILVAFASGLHSSAMVFFLLVPLVRGEYSRGRLALAALLAVPGTLLMLRSEAAEVAVSRYVDTGIDAAGAAARVALLVLTGLYFLFVLGRRRVDASGEYKLLRIGSFGMIGLAAILPISTVIADRLGYYLVPLQAVMFARIPYLPLGRNRPFHAAVPYVVLGLVLLVWTTLSWHFHQCYLPYRTWLFGRPDSRLGLGF